MPRPFRAAAPRTSRRPRRDPLRRAAEPSAGASPRTLSNALQHPFPGRSAGRIRVRLGQPPLQVCALLVAQMAERFAEVTESLQESRGAPRSGRRNPPPGHFRGVHSVTCRLATPGVVPAAALSQETCRSVSSSRFVIPSPRSAGLVPGGRWRSLGDQTPPENERAIPGTAQGAVSKANLRGDGSPSVRRALSRRAESAAPASTVLPGSSSRWRADA